MKKETAERILEEMRRAYAAASSSPSETHARLYGAEARRFADYVREGEAVLDVGCGEGERYALFESKRVHYAGVDLSEAMLARARTRLAGRDARFEAGDLLELPVPDGRYDAAVAAGILHHMPSEEHRRRALLELRRAVRPGGYVMIAVWNFWAVRHWRVLLHQFFGMRNGWGRGDLKISWKMAGPPRYFHAFTLKELRNLLAETGLEPVELAYVRDGGPSGWLKARNLIAVARRPA